MTVGRLDGNDVLVIIADAVGRPPSQVEGDLLHVGSGQIVDCDVVGVLALCLELDALDTVEIDGAPGTFEHSGGWLDGGAVGRNLDGLAAIFAAEVKCVEAGSALDNVIAVAGIPDERVVAVAEERCVGAFTSDDRIVAVSALEDVVAAAADEGVVAVAA